MPSPIPVATPAFGYRLCYANFDPVAFAVIRGRPEQFIDEMDAPLFGAAFSPDLPGRRPGGLRAGRETFGDRIERDLGLGR